MIRNGRVSSTGSPLIYIHICTRSSCSARARCLDHNVRGARRPSGADLCHFLVRLRILVVPCLATIGKCVVHVGELGGAEWAPGRRVLRRVPRVVGCVPVSVEMVLAASVVVDNESLYLDSNEMTNTYMHG